MIEEAVFPVMEALMLSEDATSERGVTIGQINNAIREFGLDEESKTGMGMVAEALDQMEEEGDVVSIEHPIDPTKNGRPIGRKGGVSLTYRLNWTSATQEQTNPA
jgi:predicted metal-dependent phosphoesterase TrpH